MTTVDTELDIHLLVGEMPAVGCESLVHGEDPCHADGDEQYIKVHLPNCACQNGIFVYCGKYIKYLLMHSNLECVCTGCKAPFIMGEAITVLGPANK
jgi:hypothetical protein